MLTKPPLKRIPSDAPGRNPTGSGVAADAAVFLLAVVHDAVVPHVLRAGLRFSRPAREAHRLRDADGLRPVAAVAARPGALLLLPRPVERGRPRAGGGPPGGVAPGPAGRTGRRRGRRHPVQAQGEEGLGGGVVPRRIGAGAGENRLRQQLGHPCRDRLPAGDLPPGRGPGDGEAGDKRHELEIAAVAGPPHGGTPGRRAARPPGPRHGRFRLRRRRAEGPARRSLLDDPAAEGRRPARPSP